METGPRKKYNTREQSEKKKPFKTLAKITDD